MTRWTKRLALGSAALGLLLVGRVWGVADEKAAQSEKVFELRTYITNDGKLDDLHRRFRDVTTKLFEKHGIENVGYWTPVDDQAKQSIITIAANPSRDGAKANWKAFMDDPETGKLLEKHGVKGASLSVDERGPANTLIYMVAHPSREAARANWKSFGSDPDWKEAAAASERNGRLVKKIESVYMKPTDYSKMK